MRLHVRYSLTPNNQVGVTYSKMVQFRHLLDNTSIESNNIKWVIATRKTQPATSHQVATYFQSIIKENWKFKLSSYYKKMNHLRRFQQGENIFSSLQNWEESTIEGEGKMYGVEVLFAKIKGSTQGWLSYTYSKSQRQYTDFIEQGYFPFQYDRRHLINATLTHQFPLKRNKERQISLVWTYASGNWQTLPQQVSQGINGLPLPSITAINNYQLPTSHRLDISYYQKKTTPKGFQHSWNMGIYNTYGRNNPYSIELQYAFGSNQFDLIANNLSVTPIPYVTYGFRF